MDIFKGIDPLSIAALTLAVIGFVRLYTAVLEKDYRTAGIIVVSGIVGAVFSPFVIGVTWFYGMLIGFTASGVITTASYLGKK